MQLGERLLSEANRRQRDLDRSDYHHLAAFRRVLRQFLAFSESAARAAGLSPQQHQALLAIKGRDGSAPTIGDVAGDLAIRHNSMVGLADRLERGGLLRRQSDPKDGRRVVLALTSDAEKLLAQLTAAHREELRRLTPVLKLLLAEIGD
ncbi:MAG: MarR family transcriptional regulator [Alphaproteobacteria bacterium]|nr:MarR family transcriptional regulator [Alphaproteobacteria bacterium]